MRCSTCRTEAPTVLHGSRARCAACGAPRPMLASTPVNLAGSASRFGGALATAFGFAVLFGGLGLAFAIGGVLHALGSYLAVTGLLVAAYAVGAPLALLSLVLGVSLLRGGRKLDKSGVARSRGAQRDAVRAFAARHGGAITSQQAANVLAMPETAADAMLTELAKTPGEGVDLDIDEDGKVVFSFPELIPPGALPARYAKLRARLAEPPRGRSRELDEDEAPWRELEEKEQRGRR